MIIINTKGGLGNQMLQYALYLTMREAGKDVRICTEHFEWATTEKRNLIQPHGKKFLVEEIFKTQGFRASAEEVGRLSTVRMDLISRARRKLGIEKKTHLFEEKMGHPSIDQLLSLDNVFLDGYWQRFDYFSSAESAIRKEYTYRKPLVGRNEEFSRKMMEDNSVSIHVRRNDYLNAPAFVVQGEEYYRDAVKTLSQRISSPVFYCFSDDQEWCREHLDVQGNPLIFVDWNTGDNSYLDMRLMSLCRANIITNSTFSMWAAWLNQRDDKFVLRPKRYYSDPEIDNQFYWPKEWIKV